MIGYHLFRKKKNIIICGIRKKLKSDTNTTYDFLQHHFDVLHFFFQKLASLIIFIYKNGATFAGYDFFVLMHSSFGYIDCSVWPPFHRSPELKEKRSLTTFRQKKTDTYSQKIAVIMAINAIPAMRRRKDLEDRPKKMESLVSW